MTQEAFIEKVKQRYAQADEATLQAVLLTLQDTAFASRLSTSSLATEASNAPSNEHSKPPLKFVGENPSAEAYRKLSLDERGGFKQRLKEQNREWLDEKFSSLSAAWIMVLNGEVIAFDDNLDSYPDIEQIREISSRYGKRPFLFINDLFIAIEESYSHWHPTAYRNDFYPTVSMTLRTSTESIAINADFDTGASSSFVDRDFLVAHHIVERDEDREPDVSRHLSQTFKFFRQPIHVEVTLSTGEAFSRILSLNCVINWKNSPFVQINPKRTALAGRDLFLKLQPAILLDFANRRTTISATPPTA